MKKNVLWMTAGILFFAGILVLAFPTAVNLAYQYRSQKTIVQFCDENAADSDAADDTLFLQMEEYNLAIYQNQQKDLCDAWSYQQNIFHFDAAGLADDMIGYLVIEAMDVQIPLYIGASNANMSKGAAVLGQTSMPIGGENTNCVIAAHRGYGSVPMFRNIEALEYGDQVVITNLWDTLTYEVVKSIVIDPDDIDAVKIIPGQDLVTLITCHPYTKNVQRYVVYCRRVSDGEENQDQKPAKKTEALPEIAESVHGVEYVSSEKDIRLEEQMYTIRILTVAASCFVLLLWFFVKKIRRHFRRM